MIKYLKIIILLIAYALLMLVSSCRKDSNKNEPQPDQNPPPTPFTLNRPPGFPPIPANKLAFNPLTVEGIALGRRLFYDPILSRDSSISCASCHVQAEGFADKRTFSVGVDGRLGHRQAMPLVNLIWQSTFFWDGRAAPLNHQALFPIVDPNEMDEHLLNVKSKLQQHPVYSSMFNKAFGPNKIDPDYLGFALEQFMFTLISANSKFDLARTNPNLFSPSEARGRDIFMREFSPPGSCRPAGGDCFHCHGGILTRNDILNFSNNGLDNVFSDLGRGGHTQDPNDMGKFQIPSLRNIALTAPYMHDGRFKTLREVIDHYNNGGIHSSTLDPNMKAVGVGLGLTPQNVSDLIDFLHTFTDTTFINNPAFMSPF